MRDALVQSLTLVSVSGYFIIAAILVLLATGVVLTFAIRARYGRLASDLRDHVGDGTFRADVLNQIARDTRTAFAHHPGEINTQAIIDHNFQSHLRGLLIGERLVKSCASLPIVLGLLGTFYGLTLSIGKLATLVSGDVTDASAITESLTAGLTQALTGMSVAFSTSLFGILAAIVMTLLGVFWSVADRRTAVMAQIEAYLDNVLLDSASIDAEQATGAAGAPGPTRGRPAQPLDQSIATLEQTVARLGGAVTHFESALKTFASTTRDFHEFNLHLKDNVQRMSLSFADLSDTLKEHARAIKSNQ
jgi:methyl-accepting chemotaxis protein